MKEGGTTTSEKVEKYEKKEVNGKVENKKKKKIDIQKQREKNIKPKKTNIRKIKNQT